MRELPLDVPGENARHEAAAPFGRRPQKPATARHKIPFVQIGDIPIGCYGENVEGDIAGNMRTIDKNGNIALAADPHHLRNRQDERRA